MDPHVSRLPDAEPFTPAAPVWPQVTTPAPESSPRDQEAPVSTGNENVSGSLGGARGTEAGPGPVRVDAKGNHEQPDQGREASLDDQVSELAVRTSIDWDAATAAALSDEPESPSTVSGTRATGGSAADRLLEDIIREIVGDAAADTVSSLQPARPGPASDETAAASDDPARTSPMIASEPDSEYVPESEPVPVPVLESESVSEPEPVLESESVPESDSEPGGGREPEPVLSDSPPADSVPGPGSRGESLRVPDPAPARAWERATTTMSQPDPASQQAPQSMPSPASAPTAVSVSGAERESDIESPARTSTSPAITETDVARGASTRAPEASFPISTPDTVGSVESDTAPAIDTDQGANARPATSAALGVAGSAFGVSRETLEPISLPVSRETGLEHGGTPLADQLADETRRRLALDEAVLPLPASTRILTISNQKGGVGKTTTAVNLAAALARAGAHVLVIDLDPQGNASTALGVDHRSEQQSVYEVLVADLPLADVIRPSTEHEHLDCVPATIHLAGAEIELVSLVAREQRLRRALDTHLATMERPYDYVFIDCPPSLGLLTINAFVAAREVLIPIQCEYYALEGLSQLLSNIELIEKHLNSDLRLSTILLTMYDSRTNLAQQVAQEVRDHFPSQTLDTIIPRSVRVSEAPSYGQSVISYDFASSGSLSYREAAAEIARRSASNPKETTDGN